MTQFINNAKTAAFLGLMFAFLLLIGSRFGTGGLTIAFLLGGMMNIIAYFCSDKIALSAMRAQQVDESTAPDLVTMVQRLANNANLPMPRVYICPQDAPNAFATGRNPSKAAVAVTHGALRLLSYEELEGVMAHELAHVKNRDTLISCVAATIAGVISYLGWIMLWFGGSDSRDSNPLLGLLLVIFGPIAAAIIQMAISRSREFVADADAASIAGTPAGLISALQKLDAASQRIPLHDGRLETQNHMFIVQPFSGKSLGKLFSTHPPTAQRVAKLRDLG